MSGIKRKILSLLFLLPPSGVTWESGGSWADITEIACVKYRNNKLVVFLKWRKNQGKQKRQKPRNSGGNGASAAFV